MRTKTPGRWSARTALLAFLTCHALALFAQPAGDGSMDVNAWLLRAHQASRQQSYAGTFVVTSSNGLSSARIWHACEGNQQIERVEALSGSQRATYRRNDQVVTFFMQSRVVVTERRPALGVFPDLLKSGNSAIGEYYKLSRQGEGRIAGLDADIVTLTPSDALRYGYRVWSEKNTGLVLQLQTLDLNGKVLEQSAFSELQLHSPVNARQLSQLMHKVQGYRVQQTAVQAVNAQAQGWELDKDIAGFRPMGCFQRPALAGNGSDGNATLQWVFSDGLATVSLFIESLDGQHHLQEGSASLGGATNSVSHRLRDWSVTAVGEVPVATLGAFVQALEHKQ